MQIGIESLRSAANRSFMMGGAIGKAAVETACIAGRTGYFLTGNVVNLVLQHVSLNSSPADRSEYDTLLLPAPVDPIELAAGMSDVQAEQAAQLGPIGLLLSASSDANKPKPV